MRTNTIGLRWLVLFLSVASLAAAANDGRLVEAVKKRDTAAVRALLKQHVDVNAPQPDGATALHWAAQWDDLDTATLLIRAGARVNAADDYGVTPLSLACTNGNASMVETLLQAGANPNAALPTGETALMTAARTGKVDAVKALLARGANLNAKETSSGQTALMWAAAEGVPEVVQVVIEHGADVHARSTAGFTPLLFAARVGDLKTTRTLLDAGATVNEAAANGTTALVVATIRGHTAFAEFLLDQGADPNAGPGFTPLHWAAGDWDRLAGDTTGIQPEENEWSAFRGLRGDAKLSFVKALLAHGANPNARAATNPRSEGGNHGGVLAGGTPFLMAAIAGDVRVMRTLLASGADPQLATARQTTPLMMAAGMSMPYGPPVPESNALEAVKLCLEVGNDINAANANGETPLHAAAYRGLEGANSIVQFLVDHGARINAKNKRGWTPLTIAEGIFFLGGAGGSASPSTAELLRKLGADPSPPDIERDESVPLPRQ